METNIGTSAPGASPGFSGGEQDLGAGVGLVSFALSPLETMNLALKRGSMVALKRERLSVSSSGELDLSRDEKRSLFTPTMGEKKYLET